MSLREQRKADTHAQIASAARALLEERGLEGTTFRAIAQRAGVSVGTVHNYAGSKARLVVDLFVDDLEQVIAERTQTLPDVGLIAQMMHFFDGFLRLYAAHPGLSRTYIKESIFAPDDSYQRYLELSMRFVARLGDLVARSGQLRDSVDPMLAAQLLFDNYLGVVVVWLRAESPEVEAVEAMLEGRLETLLGLMR